MRIVYDYAGRGPAVPAAARAAAAAHASAGPAAHGGPASPARRGSETVIVVSIGKAEGGPATGATASQSAGRQAGPSAEALARDREVRGHENTHLAALGPYAASAIQYDTVSTAGGGIAVGGRIAVDLAEVPGDPAATLRKAKAVFAAANAVGDPSAADLRVAASAYRLMQQAQSELKTDELA